MGRRTKLEHGSGLLTYYEYGNASRLTKLHNKKSDATVVAGLDYVYDQASRRTAKVVNLLEADDSRAQHTIYYDYDKAGQLTLENRRQTSGLTLIHSNYFTYDATGNRSIWQRGERGTVSTRDSGLPKRKHVTNCRKWYHVPDFPTIGGTSGTKPSHGGSESAVFLWSKVRAACEEELRRVTQETLRPWWKE